MMTARTENPAKIMPPQMVSPALEKCFALYIQITAVPIHAEMLEYASRYRKLSFAGQGELAHMINEHYREDRHELNL